MGRRFSALCVAVLMGGLLVACNPVQPWHNELVSINAAGADSGNGWASTHVSVSADGTKIAFASDASDLGPNDANGQTDVYVRDLVAGTTSLVSANPAGTNSGNDRSAVPTISPDGSEVAFVSRATDLAPGAASGTWGLHLYLRDLTTGVTTLASTGPTNGWAWSHPAVFSADGTKLVYTSTWAMIAPLHVVLYDTATATNTMVSVGPGGTAGNYNSWDPVISPDGTKVAFSSEATNLGPDTNGKSDVYVRDLVAGTTTVAITATAGSAYPSVFSADGTKLAFFSGGAVYRRDLSTGTNTLVSVDSAGDPIVASDSSTPQLSADASLVAFVASGAGAPGDTNGTDDVYLRDLAAGTSELISINAAGTNSGNDTSLRPLLSADGTSVAFLSLATDLGPKDSNASYDLYVRDRLSDTTTLVTSNVTGTDSVALGGGADGAFPKRPGFAFDPTGCHLVFTSTSGDFGPTDSNRGSGEVNRDVYRATLTGADTAVT